MLTITIFAAGLVCLAGVLGLRLRWAQAQVTTVAAQARADERGITLQTLIVTAVLVLMAVAAGVVIVAITNNAAEDLEQTTPNLETPCNPVEIYDPIVAAVGNKGTNGNKEGSDVGCVPVCVITAPKDDLEGADGSHISVERRITTALSPKATLVDVVKDERYLFKDGTTLFTDTSGTTISVASILGTGNSVRVEADNSDCVVIDANRQMIS